MRNCSHRQHSVEGSSRGKCTEGSTHLVDGGGTLLSAAVTLGMGHGEQCVMGGENGEQGRPALSATAGASVIPGSASQ